MSGDLVSSLGGRQGDLTPSTKERHRGKVLNFAVGWPSPDVAVSMASHMWAVAYVTARKARYDRLVAEIGPWMMARRHGARIHP